MEDDTSVSARQRAAHAEYLRLQWRLIDVAKDDPARPTLVAALADANRHWLDTMAPPDTHVGSQRETDHDPENEA